MGIKTDILEEKNLLVNSEKPPHHMGIKTVCWMQSKVILSLKNLPTTWGLRLIKEMYNEIFKDSEKPPHHMGIKTPRNSNGLRTTQSSEKPPHHMGIKT